MFVYMCGRVCSCMHAHCVCVYTCVNVYVLACMHVVCVSVHQAHTQEGLMWFRQTPLSEHEISIHLCLPCDSCGQLFPAQAPRVTGIRVYMHAHV